jgi:UDP-N-acetylglucosamine:LPS N-acetylglucosamine transferase
VLLRFGLHTAVVLALSAAVAAAALAVGRPGGSVPLELAALVAVAVVTAVPVWLSRRV